MGNSWIQAALIHADWNGSPYDLILLWTMASQRLAENEERLWGKMICVRSLRDYLWNRDWKGQTLMLRDDAVDHWA